MGKEILNKTIPNKTVGQSGVTNSGRVTVDSQELYDAFVNKKKVDIYVVITERDADAIVQEVRK